MVTRENFEKNISKPIPVYEGDITLRVKWSRSYEIHFKLDFMAKKGEKPLQCLKKGRFQFVTLLATYFLGFIWVFKDNTPFDRGS